MVNPFSALPSYVRESPKFSRFLELLNAYIVSGALQVSLFKDAFTSKNLPRFVVDALASQLNVTVDIPFQNGQPDWDSYYKQLSIAYRAKSFAVQCRGRNIDFINLDSLGDISTISVIDFSVSKENKTSMMVVYSVLAMDENLTYSIVRDTLIPNITGVGSGIYFLQYGQDVFGYDRDDRRWNSSSSTYESVHVVYGKDGITVEPTNENQFVVTSATIESVGSGYAVGDVVTTKDGISFVVVDLSVGAFLGISSPSTLYKADPSAQGVSVTGGSGTGMTVNISGAINTGYSIRGWDDAPFFPISRR